MIFQLITIAFLVSYAALILVVSAGWWKLKPYKNTGLIHEVKVSLIIAVRNESRNLQNLLNSLFQQNYPPHLLEIIIVDDHSTDNTFKLLNEISANNTGLQKLSFFTLDIADGIGKKAALDYGIQKSSGELIIITDADCTAGCNWISTMANFYADSKPQMILGPVRMTDGGNIFGKLQSLEFMSLISTAAGSAGIGFPLLANGANLAFTRKAFESCGGFNEGNKYASGDDMFLMMSLKKKFGSKGISFLLSEEAIVSTLAVKRLQPFIRQRLRWVSKSRGYRDMAIIAASLIVFLTNFWLIAMLFSTLFSSAFLKIFFFCFLIKLIIDFPLMLSFGRFLRSDKLLFFLFPVMELLNAVYTVFIGIAGNFVTYTWKGRKVSTHIH
jgi:cellulose synthase/poly-beta-1,6-N-acetylglucosamine synthase-like glycosyltransferase